MRRGLRRSVGDPAFSPADLERMHPDGRVAVLGEVGNQYSGIEPDDDRFDPYLVVAEELDIPGVDTRWSGAAPRNPDLELG